MRVDRYQVNVYEKKPCLVFSNMNVLNALIQWIMDSGYMLVSCLFSNVFTSVKYIGEKIYARDCMYELLCKCVIVVELYGYCRCFCNFFVLCVDFPA